MFRLACFRCLHVLLFRLNALLLSVCSKDSLNCFADSWKEKRDWCVRGHFRVMNFYNFLYYFFFFLYFFFTHDIHQKTYDPHLLPTPTTHDPLPTPTTSTHYPRWSFHMWRYHVFARKLTWYFIPVYIYNNYSWSFTHFFLKETTMRWNCMSNQRFVFYR